MSQVSGDRTGPEVLRGSDEMPVVVRPDAHREPVSAVVRAFDNVVVVRPDVDDLNRAEYLFTRRRCVLGDVSEDCRLYNPVVFEPVAVRRTAACENRRTMLFRPVNIFQNS